MLTSTRTPTFTTMLTSMLTPMPAPTATDPAVARTAALLRAGVPLTLLLDLAAPHGPRSRELYEREPADSMAWLLARAS